jgi:hypothetical protein
MLGNTMIVGFVLTATVLLALISVYPIDRGSELRPQAVRMLEEKIGEPTLEPSQVQIVEKSDTDNDTDNSAAVRQPPTSPNNPPSIAGTRDKTDPNVKQTIEQSVTDDSVKVRIEQKVDSNQPVRNKVNVKIDTHQDPPLVEINTEPKAVTCSVDSYDCDDFAACTQVTNVFNACPTDVHGLDPDNNGTPCDNLCE